MHDPLDPTATSIDDVDRLPVPGAPPVPGAQWDEVHARWEVWDRSSAHWVVVAAAAAAMPVPVEEMEREPAGLDSLFGTETPEPSGDDRWIIDLRAQPTPGDQIAGVQWNEVVGRWERWDDRTGRWIPAPALLGH